MATNNTWNVHRGHKGAQKFYKNSALPQQRKLDSELEVYVKKDL